MDNGAKQKEKEKISRAKGRTRLWFEDANASWRTYTGQIFARLYDATDDEADREIEAALAQEAEAFAEALYYEIQALSAHEAARYPENIPTALKEGTCRWAEEAQGRAEEARKKVRTATEARKEAEARKARTQAEKAGT